MDRAESAKDRQDLTMANIPYGRQDVTEEDIRAVNEVLRSDFLTQGPAVPAFEQAVGLSCGAGHAIAVNSATSALHIACLALGVGPGDAVWTSAITFAASANCALYCGASVDFVDIDPQTNNMSIDRLTEKLAAAKAAGRLPKVVIPVHLCGQPCDMRAIRALSDRYGFKIIEDASHAVGGRYRDEPIGTCRYSDVTVFSFHPVKLITSGEGGMAVTQDKDLAVRMRRLRTHGITRDPAEMVHASDGPWYCEQLELGFNYRMTDIHAALGRSQLARLPAYLIKRHEIAARYDRLLADLPVSTPRQAPDSYSGLHLYVVRLRLDAIESTHRQVFERLRAAGIGVNLHYIPVYRHPHYAKLGFAPGYCPEAEQYYREAISLPMYPTLGDSEQAYVVESLRSALCPTPIEVRSP
jgi:UDP-4-amino-4,6-dideoxy-N-acetyl-beta-L-altrosamine transaminase